VYAANEERRVLDVRLQLISPIVNILAAKHQPPPIYPITNLQAAKISFS